MSIVCCKGAQLLRSSSPSNEWQDKVGEILRAIAAGQPHASDTASALEQQTSDVHFTDQEQNMRGDQQPHGTRLQNAINDDDSPRQRQRRRLENGNGNDFLYSGLEVACSQSAPASTSSPQPPQYWTVPQMTPTLTIYK